MDAALSTAVRGRLDHTSIPTTREEMRARLKGKAKAANLTRKRAVEMADASKEKAAELGEKIGGLRTEAAV